MVEVAGGTPWGVVVEILCKNTLSGVRLTGGFPVTRFWLEAPGDSRRIARASPHARGRSDERYITHKQLL